MIITIVAYDENRGIGKDNKLPWHIKEELQLFKAITLYQTLLMGRKTYESLPKTLENREIKILSRNSDFTFEDIITKYQDSEEPIFICGGESVYKQFLPYTELLIVSEIKGKFDVDTYFPKTNDFETIFKKEFERFTFKVKRRKLCEEFIQTTTLLS